MSKVIYSILNTIQASAADVDLALGEITVTGFSEKLRYLRCIGADKIAYSAGVLSVKTVAIGLTPKANATYKVVVSTSKNNNKREYVVLTGATAPSAAVLAASLQAKIAAELTENAIVTATVSTSTLTLTLASLVNGDFNVSVFENGAAAASITYGVTTAFVEPSGTPDVVEAITNAEDGSANGLIKSTATYTTYKFRSLEPNRHDNVSGAFINFQTDWYLFLDTSATHYAALVTAVDAIIAGTATEADYLGIPAL